MGVLEGRKALVTGASRGIGREIALAFAREGADVAVNYHRQEEAAREVAAAIEALGRRALAVQASVAEVEPVRTMVARVLAEFGHIDILVNNAGFVTLAPVEAMTVEQWDEMLATHLRGTFLVTRQVLPGMLERGSGRIVIVGSGSAYLPGASETAYTSSKAAVCRYGETLANALRDRIPVFVISPGMVRTEMTADFPDDAPWTPPECAPHLVRALASGDFDALSGRYLHAEHDPPESLRGRFDEILEHDWNAIRLRRP